MRNVTVFIFFTALIASIHTAEIVIDAVLPAANGSIAQALRTASDTFNSMSNHVSLTMHTFALPVDRTDASICVNLSSDLTTSASLAIIDTTAESLAYEVANATLHVNGVKTQVSSNIHRCSPALTPFFETTTWAAAAVDLARRFNWSNFVVVRAQGSTFIRTIADLILEEAARVNISATLLNVDSERPNYSFLEDSPSRVLFIISTYEFAKQINTNEVGFGVSTLMNVLSQSAGAITRGLLVMSTKLSDAALSDMPPETINFSEASAIAYNAALILAQMSEYSVASGAAANDINSILSDSSGHKFNKTIGAHSYLNGTRIGDLLLANLIFESSGGARTEYLGRWRRFFGFEFSQPTDSVVWFDGSTSLPTSIRRPFVIGLAYPADYVCFEDWVNAGKVALAHVKEQNLLPGFDIDVLPIPISTKSRRTAENLGTALANSHFAAIVGGAYSDDTSPIQHLLANYKIPHLGPLISTSDMSNRDEFPLFVRINADDAQQMQALVALWEHLGWKHGAVLRGTRAEAATAVDALIRASNQTGFNLKSQQSIVASEPVTISRALNVIHQAGLRVVHLQLHEVEIEGFASYLKKSEFYKSEWAFFLSERALHLDALYRRNSSLFDGLHAFAAHSGSGPVYDRFLRDLRALGTSPSGFGPLTPGGFLKPGITYVYDSICTLVRAAARMVEKGEMPGPTTGAALYDAIHSLSFTGATGPISFKSGDRINNTLSFITRKNGDWIEWATVTTAMAILPGSSRGSNSCLHVTESPQWILSTVTPKDIIPQNIAWNSGSAIFIVVAALPTFYATGSCGVTIGVYTGVALTGELSEASCTLRVWLHVLGFILAFGSLFIKNWRIWHLYSSETMSPLYVSNMELMGYSAIMWTPFLILLIFWTIFDRPRLIMYENIQACSYGESPVSAIIMFIMMASMLLLGCVLAVVNRSVPQLYNECRYIAYSSYAYTISSIIGIFVQLELQTVSAVASYLVYGVSSLISFGTILVIFIPKIWIVQTHDSAKEHAFVDLKDLHASQLDPKWKKKKLSKEHKIKAEANSAVSNIGSFATPMTTMNSTIMSATM